jgi:AbrB family looped-hinge helix DNA binding protein
MTVEDTRRSTLRDKGQLTLPSEVRSALHVEPGDEIEFQVLETGDVIMRGLKMIPADQAWFWTESWQKGEREATADITAGRVETFKDEESFFDFIKAPEDL